MAERRCPGCGQWYAKDEGACTFCGYPPATFSKHLATAKLNNHLYAAAEQADRDRKYERATVGR